MAQFLKKFGGNFIWTRGFIRILKIFCAFNSDRDVWHFLNVLGLNS